MLGDRWTEEPPITDHRSPATASGRSPVPPGTLSFRIVSTFTPATLEAAVARFRDRHDTGTLVAALVAGSGITLTAPGWEKAAEVPYPEIFPFGIRTLAGHTPTVTVWRRGGQGILAFNGRFHLYQGYSAFEVAAIPRLAGAAGRPGLPGHQRRRERSTRPSARATSWSSATTSTSRARTPCSGSGGAGVYLSSLT